MSDPTGGYGQTGGAKKDRVRPIPMSPEDSMLADAEGTTPVQFRQGLAATGVPDIGLASQLPKRDILGEAIQSGKNALGKAGDIAKEIISDAVKGSGTPYKHTRPR